MLVFRSQVNMSVLSTITSISAIYPKTDGTHTNCFEAPLSHWIG